ncbi:hypothetical protein PPACK8108_LOCUS23799 [Phakopsora pachyrhizi]|uniref:Oxysterol binding protein n=1 Tax=Phakopsora pachyrhizi TaxID=170000 RepID=A0AAV0BR24_PHAPC|nr:hypothetical protein PPACK8108_LOCUS23799 [Phakopsora pachyrhizi]
MSPSISTDQNQSSSASSLTSTVRLNSSEPSTEHERNEAIPSTVGAGNTSNDPIESDESKLKQLLTVLKKAIGVKDMGAMRLSLPANLMAPIGNLEYWCYLDRPDIFAAIDHPDDELERMLAVVRWTFTKDCKFVHSPICKPYNSVLGEQFKCIFDVTPAKVSPDTGDLYLLEAPSSPKCSSLPSSPLPSSPTTTIPLRSQQRPSSLLTTTSSIITEDNVLGEPRRSVSTIATTIPRQSVSTRVAFLNEQVSHHPPISCFWYESRTKASETEDFVSVAPSVVAHGVDQISAKFTGTSIKIFPGPMNKGIFVRLPNRSEEYHITHPTATITGLLRASPYVVITDHTYITCKSSGTNRYRAIISYLDESWLGKARFAAEGVIYEVKNQSELEWNKIKHVPQDRIKCKLSGSWRGVINYTTPTMKKEQILVDLSKLFPVSKTVKPEENQEDYETRKFWKDLTDLIAEKNYGEATKVKHNIEEAQRSLALKRKQNNETFRPKLFEIGDSVYLEMSQPELTSDGVKALNAEFGGIGY